MFILKRKGQLYHLVLGFFSCNILDRLITKVAFSDEAELEF